MWKMTEQASEVKEKIEQLKALRCLADVKQQAHSAFYCPVADSLTVFLRREQGRLTAQLPGYGMGVGRG